MCSTRQGPGLKRPWPSPGKTDASQHHLQSSSLPLMVAHMDVNNKIYSALIFSIDIFSKISSCFMVTLLLAFCALELLVGSVISSVVSYRLYLSFRGGGLFSQTCSTQ